MSVPAATCTRVTVAAGAAADLDRVQAQLRRGRVDPGQLGVRHRRPHEVQVQETG
jgi:hypothetical protein